MLHFLHELFCQFPPTSESKKIGAMVYALLVIVA